MMLKNILKLLFLFHFINESFAMPLQNHASIDQTVKQYVETKLQNEPEFSIELGRLDPRLQFPLCDKPLQAFTRNHSIKSGRNAIGVKCNGEKKWTVYHSALVNIFKHVITLTHPIRRGDQFSENCLRMEKKNIANLGNGYFTDKKSIIGKQATRNLIQGSIITPPNVTEPKLVKRGDKVEIKLSNPSLEISMAGIALMNGIKNQSIRVKNTKTKKIIQATVIKPGQVKVNF